MHRISNRLARQNAQLREAEKKSKAMQAERARLLDRTVQATEQERRRVALDLHDGPVQHLSALDLILEGVSMALPSDQSKSGSMVKKVQLRLRDEVTGLRRLMTELRPPALDERGLEAALRDHVNSVQSRSGVQCTVESTLSGRLDPAREIVLYRVAQEALTNVAKHSEASHAWLSLREVNSHVEIEIRDDGRGFDPSGLGDLAMNGHFGVLGMRERVEMAGGRWELQSSPARGTVVRAILPKESNGNG
jgi:signal transduction histidine kinase